MWGIYSTPSFEGADAFAEGLRKVGCAVAMRSAWDYSRSCLESFEAVAVFGLHGRGQEILRQYSEVGVPVVVIDYGYLKRTNHAHDWRTGHWQVSLNGLNRLPDDVDSSRFDALGIEINERGGDPDGYTLLCVQTPDDKSHGKSQEQLQEWCAGVQGQYPDVLIRPHPLAPDLDYGLPRCEAKALSDALRGARVVVTGNSNTGHDALLAGVPVVGLFEGAAWTSLSGEQLPSIEARRRHFSRCAWGQWTWDEFRSGLPQRFLIERNLQ